MRNIREYGHQSIHSQYLLNAKRFLIDHFLSELRADWMVAYLDRHLDSALRFIRGIQDSSSMGMSFYSKIILTYH